MAPPFALLLVLALASPSRPVSRPDRELLAAARRGDAARMAALIRSGVDVNATTASGSTALIEVVSAGRLDLARMLLDAGADADIRERERGTALDVAERAGRRDLAALLRERGARGSGKSVGDTVCVKRWAGSGFCAQVEDRSDTRYHLRVLRLEGCGAGCAPDPECSGARPVGGTGVDAVRPGVEVVVPSWCLTQTAVPPPR